MSKREKRLNVATNAVAGAMFGVGDGTPIKVSNQQKEAARAIALRVLDHIDRYDTRGTDG